jgi:hypothetical protein
MNPPTLSWDQQEIQRQLIIGKTKQFFLRSAIGLAAAWGITYPMISEKVAQTILFRSFTELTAFAALGAFICRFAENEVAAGFGGATAYVQTVPTLLCRWIGSICVAKRDVRFFRIGAPIFQWAIPILSLHTSMSLMTLIHELGHGLAAKIFTENSVRIRLFSLTSGGTQLQSPIEEAPLSQLGGLLGRRKVKIAYIATGPLLQSLVSFACLKAGSYMKESMPEISRQCLTLGAFSLINLGFYSIEALTSSNLRKGHDFGDLKKMGIHPIAALTVIVAIPLFALAFKAFGLSIRKEQTV